jgi:hypothetical protein
VRLLRLGYAAGKVFRLPVIRKLKEPPPRSGFFEAAQYAAVRRHLAPDLQVVIDKFFPHLSGRRAGTRRRDFRGAWVAATRAAGCPGRLRHDFRRTAVRNLERAHVPRSVAMKLTDHRTESVYRRYAIVSDADLQAASERLATAVGHNLGHNSALRMTGAR